MALVLRSFREVLRFEGVSYTVRACGRQREDGVWEGWLEFEPGDGSTVLRTPRETTQPKLTALKYWASGLSAVYLEGAFDRAVDAELPDELPSYNEPAPPPSSEEVPGPSFEEIQSELEDLDAEVEDLDESELEDLDEPVLDPFAVYNVEGEDALRQQLAVLNHAALQSIVRAFGLVAPGELDLEALDEPSLVDLIVAAVRRRLAA
jgi:hypothetical protein